MSFETSFISPIGKQKKKGRKEFQWEAWNPFQMTSDGATRFNVTEHLGEKDSVLNWIFQGLF